MRILHTMLRVGDLQRSIDFYTRVLGMKLLRTSDNPEYQYTLAFVGYGSNPDHAELELTYNYGTTSYERWHRVWPYRHLGRRYRRRVRCGTGQWRQRHARIRAPSKAATR